jgi:beta-glucosidase
MTPTSPAFPPGFMLGTSTSAYQIEGAVQEAGRGSSIWDTFSHTPGKVYRGDTGDIACDHYHRLSADLDLIAELGCQTYRFSIAWPRVIPAGRGPVNHPGLDLYKRLLQGLYERGIVPMATLYHWDLPQPLQDAGGWAARDTAARFADYAAAVVAELGDLVPFWVTLNEPWCSAFVGYLQGRHAPGLTDLAVALRASHYLMLGHGYACQALRAGPGSGQVGISLNLTDVVPGTGDPLDKGAAERIDGFENRWFLDPVRYGRYPEDMLTWYAGRADVSFANEADLIAQPLDFLGVNYYEYQRIVHDQDEPVHAARELPPASPATHGGAPIEPAALTRVLCRVHENYGPVPLYVTENGASFNDYTDPEGQINDHERIEYLGAHLAAAAESIRRGVDLRGYYVWSLMDNFEWAHGYGSRFGLIYVDFRTQTRIPKASAAWFRAITSQQKRSSE